MIPTQPKMFINNDWQPSSTGETFPTVDPSTEEVIAQVPRGRAADVEQAIAAARDAFEGPWWDVAPKDRAQRLYKLARALEAKTEAFAQIEVQDSGKPYRDAVAEVGAVVRYFDYFAGAADKIHGETIPMGSDYIDFTLREPLGVTAHITPWNVPLSMVARSVAPALAAGNTVVVKPAEQTSLATLKLGELFVEVGFPPGVYNVVTGYGEEAGAALASHPGIDGITFTGSVETGRKIMQMAAEHIKPVVLELGGKSPHIIFDDADIDIAADQIITGIYSNAGQYCDAGSRLLVHRGIKDALLKRLTAATERMVVGPAPTNPDMGPLISAEQYERVMDYIDIGRTAGAQVLTGGGRPAGTDRGYFVAPTVFDEVDVDMRIAQEEIFGPVLTVFPFEDTDDALHIANHTRYGLSAGIFTRDIHRALCLAKRIKAGMIYINEYFAYDVALPFGGYKQSGIGREGGMETLRNYTQVKNVVLRLR